MPKKNNLLTEEEKKERNYINNKKAQEKYKLKQQIKEFEPDIESMVFAMMDKHFNKDCVEQLIDEKLDERLKDLGIEKKNHSSLVMKMVMPLLFAFLSNKQLMGSITGLVMGGAQQHPNYSQLPRTVAVEEPKKDITNTSQ